jgi:NAD(P)H-hydrate epimerase
MENAARSVADVAMSMLAAMAPEHGGPGWVVVLCGAGNNGGDGYAVARHLHNRYCNVEICATDVSALKGDAAVNYNIIRAMGIPIVPMDQLDLSGRDLVVDALFGTGLTRPITSPIALLIEKVINPSTVSVLAVDVPSGMDADTGEPLGACIRADRTVTFVAIKQGFDNPNAPQYTGIVTVGDIGVPRELIAAVLA